MKRADKITKTAGHPVCPYCKHPNDVFHFNLHKEGETIKASCDKCGAEYIWLRYVVELFISEPMPEPVVVREGAISPQDLDSVYNTPGEVHVVQDEGEIR